MTAWHAVSATTDASIASLAVGENTRVSAIVAG
jgi:hypothetical protein